MKKRQKKILIIIFVIILIMLVVLLALNNAKKKNNDTNSLNSTTNVENEDFSDIKTEDVGGPVFNTDNLPKNNQIINVSGKLNYFKVKSILENYINLAGARDERVFKILSEKYVKEYGVDANNVFNKLNVNQLQNPKQYYKIIANQILTAKIDSSTNVYIVSGNYRIMGNDSGNSIKIMIETNEIEKTYTIYPEEYINSKGYNDIKLNSFINFEKEDITRNDYNRFLNKTISDKEIVSEYFNNFRELINYYPDLAFEKINPEYASKRFGTKAEFMKYKEQNKFRFALMDINEYTSEKGENYTDYICTDYYNNIYIFRQTEYMTNYSVFLDDYTITLGYEANSYDSLEDYEKAIQNVRKFEKMLNSRDYSAIYNVLDNTFKANNYGSIEKLKAALDNNIYRINGIQIVDFSMDDAEYFVYSCELQNKESSTQKKDMTIVIKLGEGTNFTMSFSFK